MMSASHNDIYGEMLLYSGIPIILVTLGVDAAFWPVYRTSRKRGRNTRGPTNGDTT